MIEWHQPDDWSPRRGSVCADVSGWMGAVVQRKHRWPHIQEGAGTHRQRRRQAGSQPQPQDPHIQEPTLSHQEEVLISF